MPDDKSVGTLNGRGGTRESHGLILFDGFCVLCSRGCRFVSRRDRKLYFRYVAMQSPEGREIAASLGINPDQPDTFAFIDNGMSWQKSDAAIRIARRLPGWRWISVLLVIPRGMRDAIYDLIARNRYRWFGRYDHCLLPNMDGTWPQSKTRRHIQ